jgi:hypothetical protein
MSVCGMGARCHVQGKGITKFGHKFTQAKVMELASSCVVLIDTSTSDHVATGVLIAQNVIICAVHSLSGVAMKNLEALLLFECDSKTAPGFTPVTDPLAPPPPPPPPCSPLTTTPQIKIDSELENGRRFGLDYALLAISWKQSKVKFPRTVTLPYIDVHNPVPNLNYMYGGELVAIGHPIVSKKAEPTQAAVGKHIGAAAHGPHPNPKDSTESSAKEYTYADFYTTDGMSGGGVFNEAGRLVGIITGWRRTGGKQEFGFLNLGLVVGKIVTSGGAAQPASARLKKWMGSGSPLLDTDPKLPASVTFDPPLK